MYILYLSEGVMRLLFIFAFVVHIPKDIMGPQLDIILYIVGSCNMNGNVSQTLYDDYERHHPRAAFSWSR